MFPSLWVLLLGLLASVQLSPGSGSFSGAVALRPPRDLYSCEITNTNLVHPVIVKVRYELKGSEYNDVVEKLIEPGQSAKFNEKKFDHGSWQSIYSIENIMAKPGHTSASNAIAMSEAPFDGISSPTRDFKFDIVLDNDTGLISIVPGKN